MASQPPAKDAKARELRATGREDMAVLTSGARHKVDTTLAGAAALGQQLLHPFDKNARAQAQEAAEEKKKLAAEKRDDIQSVAAQQGEQGRLAARGQAGEATGGVGGENHPSARSPVQQGIHAPVEELDRADLPTSDKQHTSLGEMLASENTEENPHIEHIKGNNVHNPHLDRNLEFKNPGRNENFQSNDVHLSREGQKSDHPGTESEADEYAPNNALHSTEEHHQAERSLPQQQT